MKTVIIDRFKVTHNYSLGICYVKNEDGSVNKFLLDRKMEFGIRLKIPCIGAPHVLD